MNSLFQHARTMFMPVNRQKQAVRFYVCMVVRLDAVKYGIPTEKQEFTSKTDMKILMHSKNFAALLLF